MKIQMLEDKALNPKELNTQDKVKEYFKGVPQKTAADLQFALDLLMEQGIKGQLDSIVEESFSQPLREQNGILKQMLEIFASKWRYHLFVLGLTIFLILLFLRVIYPSFF